MAGVQRLGWSASRLSVPAKSVAAVSLASGHLELLVNDEVGNCYFVLKASLDTSMSAAGIKVLNLGP